jgi:geranylgeranyl diphosphate synthase type II
MDLKSYLAEKRALIDKTLKDFMPEPEGPTSELIRAMNYSLFAGGKRLRPILCMAGAEAVGGEGRDALPVACALEMIHTYSLIHDDLPAMDNDDMRRGKPTSHKVFGEALAILAGDGLLTEAFNLMIRSDLPEKIGTARFQEVITLISLAAGHRGIVGGQAVDVMMEGKEVDSSIVDFIHNHKTGALISASVSSGAILGGGSRQELDEIASYGNKIGLAFQISDDILNIEGDSEKMGKRAGSDEQKRKNTYPSVYGMERSKVILKESVDAAINSLKQFGNSADPLRQIADYIIERKK